MNEHTAAALLDHLQDGSHADMSTLATATDTRLSIGQDVWRLRWRDQITTAVASDADLHTTCGALLDALAIFECSPHDPHADLSMDRSAVNVLIDRPLPDDTPSEADQAMRSLRDAVQGVTARIWYRRAETGWIEDTAPAPTWPAGDKRGKGWVDDLLLPRLTTPPGALALHIVDAVNDPSLHLYPSAIGKGPNDVWALRIDGLQIGTVGLDTGTLTIGKPGKNGDGPQRKTFTEVFGTPSVTITTSSDEPGDGLSVPAAAEKIRALLLKFRETDIRGAPLAHRIKNHVPIIDEHTLEARLLKGLIPHGWDKHQLVLDDELVARGSQFPTLWGHGAKPRYLDALLRHGSTPLAIELKVATGGQGRYYRRSLIQAVLYRHFITHADDLDAWFDIANLNRHATRACIGVPIPARWSPRFTNDLELLTKVAARIGAEVRVLDDRATPDWGTDEQLPEPDSGEQYEALAWRLVAALSHRWPTTLGRIVETHDCGGFYDRIQLQPLDDRSVDWPAQRPRVSLNRPGSAWVFNQQGTPRWVWRGIWNHLASGASFDQAAATIGAIAGLGPTEHAAGTSFAQMAVQFLDQAKSPGWSWRCAWPGDGNVSEWVERYRTPLARYNRTEPTGTLPTIARIWGATRDGEVAVIIDQQNLRTWAWHNGAIVELKDPDPLERITHAARLATN